MADPHVFPLAHWSLFRCQLRWAYDQLLVDKHARAGTYVSYPVAAWLVRSGSITLRFESGTERFGPGTWIFPKDAQGVQELSSGFRILSLRFLAEWSYGAPIFDRSETVTLAETTVPELTACAEELLGVVNEIFPDRPSPLHLRGGFERYLHLQPIFMKWIAAYYTAFTAHGVRANALEALDDKIRLALHLIETHSFATPFRENELATAVGCSVSQLNKLFIKQVGQTPAFLWNHRKVEAAKSELTNSADSVKAIAYHLGYSAPEHFTHWFRRNSGRSPTEFRRLYQAGDHFLL